MKQPLIPLTEPQRLAVLESCSVLDTPPEWRFDDLAELAATCCETPIALVSLVDGTRQWFKARVGLDATETPREISFCGHVVHEASPLVVGDTLEDERFADNPLVLGGPRIRFYAGEPVVVDGEVMGTLCVIDTRPRALSELQGHQLRRLAGQVSSQLELRRRNLLLQERGAQLVASRAELAEASSQFEAFFDISLEVMAIFSLDGFLLRINPAWERILGFTIEELRGRHFTDLVHPDDLEATREQAARLAEPGTRIQRLENRYQTKSGEWRWFSWCAASDVASERIYATARDVTQEVELAALKEQFISTVSHELRTPLTSIRGALGLVGSGRLGELPPTVSELLQIAERNSTRLARLVNDILDMERLESGALHLELASVDLLEVARGAVEAAGTFAPERELRYELDHDGSRLDLEADAHRLRQVFDNLLGNAAKFSPDGARIRIRLRTEGTEAVVSVVDEGPGIPEAARERIFDRFVQVDGSDTRTRGGSGLGLAICKAIIEDHGGRIGVSAAPGGGSDFTFHLPLAVEVEPLEPAARRVLVCEDDPDVSRLLEVLLGARGFEVETVHTAAEAREAVRAGGWAAMTLDLGLPDQDGLSLLGELRREGHELPVVVLTGTGPERDSGAEDLGLRCWLQKPIDEHRLVHCLRALRREPGSSSARVLHVEDDPGLRKVVDHLLHHDAEVVGAATLARARALLDSRDFDVVVLDLGLPDGDGVQLLDLLHRRHAGLPVVIFTGQEPPEAVRARAWSTLVKSRHSEERLAEVVSRLIEQVGRGSDEG